MLLAAAALIPAIVLLVYVYKKDRSEKEPVGLLALLFVLGAVTCAPAALIEELLGNVNLGIFENFCTSAGGELYFNSNTAFYAYNIIDNFLITALAEEGLKWLVLYFVTRKNKNFNSLFDGIIYSVFVSLGFAALENVMYVMGSGFDTAVMRAVTAVPGHMFDAVIMGCFYSLWHIAFMTENLERSLKTAGIIQGNRASLNTRGVLLKSLFVPILAHGFYDYCLSFDSWLSIVMFYTFLAAMYYYCFRKIKDFSKRDGSDITYALGMIINRNPELSEFITEYVTTPDENGNIRTIEDLTAHMRTMSGVN